jgi:hypothetical protein
VRISPEALVRNKQELLPAAPGQETSEAALPGEDPKLAVMRLILESLTGKKIRIVSFSPGTSGATSAAGAAASAENVGSPRQGWGMEYDLVERVSEEETMRFSAVGQVRTADGRAMDFQLALVMERQFAQETGIHLRAGDALLLDPLAINFAGNAAELSDMRVSFDLDGDGRKEEISFLGQGSGFLALDRNGDGIVNNGLELFGPASGRGFSELARLDGDANGWLDENDPRHADLRVWMKDAAGADHLYSLAEKNVGAIFLGAVMTPFSLKSEENALLGRIRESSVFLAETGGAGTVQEIDLAV